MRVSEGFRSYVLDQLEELGDVVPRAMFGGVGLYRGGVFFGIIAADVLYLKADEANRADFERVGSKPFRPYAGREKAMQYWAVPADVLEDAGALARWSRKALDAAARAESTRGRAVRRGS